ncbi:hypothetical protein T492DRAFT_508623 [Pavlovales sp. CCMP2436]|nr:hypothetical protein T492DRAFT_508623 [Pavlovales sp. CCMP2436]
MTCAVCAARRASPVLCAASLFHLSCYSPRAVFYKNFKKKAGCVCRCTTTSKVQSQSQQYNYILLVGQAEVTPCSIPPSTPPLPLPVQLHPGGGADGSGGAHGQRADAHGQGAGRAHHLRLHGAHLGRKALQRTRTPPSPVRRRTASATRPKKVPNRTPPSPSPSPSKSPRRPSPRQKPRQRLSPSPSPRLSCLARCRAGGCRALLRKAMNDDSFTVPVYIGF